MALATATIDFDLEDILGAEFDARRTKVWVTTNIVNDTIVDPDGGKIRLGSGTVTVNDDGQGSIVTWVPGFGSNPSSWQTFIHVDYPDRHAHGGRGKRTFGPFTITAGANLADLIEEQEVPPEYVTTLTTQLDGYVTEAEAAAAVAQGAADLASAITGLDGADDAVTLLDADAGSDFRIAQDARLSAAFAAKATQTTVESGRLSAAAVETSIATTQPRLPLLGRKIKGGNIVLKPGQTWARMWAEWDWANWIKPQVDRAVALGLNSVRLIGAPRAIFVSPGGGFSMITQAQYDARWAQLATYCLTRGLALYPSLCEKWDFYDLAPGSENYQHAGLTASIQTTATALSKFPNVIGFDVFQEGDARTGSAWAQSTAYSTVGQHVNVGGKSYKVATPGTSAASGTGPTGTGTGITDGTVVWDYDGIPVTVTDVLALMAAIRTVSGVPLTMSFPPYANNVPWHNTDYMWALVYTNAAGADFIDAHVYSSAVVPSDLDFLAHRTGKPFLIGEYGIAQDATTPNQTARMVAVADVHNRTGVLGSFVWGLADQSTTDSGKFGVWDNTGYALGASPLSVTSGQRTTLTSKLPTFRVADAPPAYRSPNLLDSQRSRPRNTTTSSWSASANTSLQSDPRGLGFKSQAAGDIVATIRATDPGYYTVAPNTWYRLRVTFLSDTVARSCEIVLTWADSAGTTLASSSIVSGTSSTSSPLTLDLMAKSHASAGRVQLIARVKSTAAANELHVLVDGELTAV